MNDMDDISVSGHSIGIVENPLFADNDGLEEMPSYAALSAKEKAAEVSNMHPILRKTVMIEYSISACIILQQSCILGVTQKRSYCTVCSSSLEVIFHQTYTYQ